MIPNIPPFVQGRVCSPYPSQERSFGDCDVRITQRGCSPGLEAANRRDGASGAHRPPWNNSLCGEFPLPRARLCWHRCCGRVFGVTNHQRPPKSPQTHLWGLPPGEAFPPSLYFKPWDLNSQDSSPTPDEPNTSATGHLRCNNQVSSQALQVEQLGLCRPFIPYLIKQHASSKISFLFVLFQKALHYKWF